MRIQSFERVVYEHNPLAEVVCQLRFVRMTELETPDGLVDDLESAGYANSKPGVPGINIQIHVGPQPSALSPDAGSREVHIQQSTQQMQTYSSSTEDGAWSVAFNAESISLVCTKYSSWDEFLPRFVEATTLFAKWHPGARANRLGLRYRDVIDREAIGLDSVDWDELIQPFLLGAMGRGVFADGKIVPQDDVKALLTQSIVNIDNCALILQSALLRSVEDAKKTVFMIDADFSKDSDDIRDVAYSPEQLKENLNILHQYAGAMFKRGIKEKLHAALKPRH